MEEYGEGLRDKEGWSGEGRMSSIQKRCNQVDTHTHYEKRERETLLCIVVTGCGSGGGNGRENKEKDIEEMA